MAEHIETHEGKRHIWVRGIYMILMAIIFHVSEAVLLVVALVQFIMALGSDAPNERLVRFGRSLGRYVEQIADFLTFASEEVPFPFSDWPSGS